MLKVHHELGCGFYEKVYQEALEIELKQAGIPFRREVPLQIIYKGIPLKQVYIADFVCYDKIIVELKAVSVLDSSHTSQVVNYLKATKMDLGLLANFGEESLKVKRVINIKH